MKTGLCVLGIVMLLSSNLWAQTAQEAEQQIKAYTEQLQYWRYQYSPEDSGVDPNASTADSILHYNKILVNYLENAGRSNGVLRGKFTTGAEDEIKIANSEDGKMRVYSWDTETGDEMHIYNAVLQYEVGGAAKTKVLKDIAVSTDNKKDPGFLYPEILTVNGNRRYYLLIYSGILSSKDAIKGVRAFVINNNEIEDANIFPSTEGLSNKIAYTYDYFSNYDYKKMGEKQVINMKQDKLYVPLADAGKINGKWNVYKFQGDKFVKE